MGQHGGPDERLSKIQGVRQAGDPNPVGHQADSGEAGGHVRPGDPPWVKDERRGAMSWQMWSDGNVWRVKEPGVTGTTYLFPDQQTAETFARSSGARGDILLLAPTAESR